MTKSNPSNADPSIRSRQDLRKRTKTEWKARKKQTAPLPSTEPDTRRLVHELEVHQIELEMQNEELVKSRAAVEELLLQYTDLYDFAPVGYFTLARDGTIRQANLAGARLLGVERSELIKRRFGWFVSTDHRRAFQAFLKKVFDSREKETCEITIEKEGQKLLWIRVEAISHAGQRETCRAMVSDITECKRVEEALLESATHFRQVWDATSDAMALSNSEGIVLNANQAYFDLYGYTSEQVIGKSFAIIFPEEYREQAVEQYKAVFASEDIPSIFEAVVRRADGAERVVDSRATFITVAGQRTAMLSAIRDITERKQAEDVLRHLSTHDALTGLYNRGFFVAEMERLERGRQFPTSIVMADVDQLKKVNDLEGHAAGDALLKRVAQALTAVFRGEDVVARVGGDEFAVLLPATDAATAEVALRRVRQILQEQIADQITPLSLSLGVSTAVTAMPLSKTLHEADAAMYRDKHNRNAS
ncbi:MAG: PAS domain S-box protein [Chloroflexi bacterium]|nr:PAS domain S-box protein [Chloroflexota bacterium]